MTATWCLTATVWLCTLLNWSAPPLQHQWVLSCQISLPTGLSPYMHTHTQAHKHTHTQACKHRTYFIYILTWSLSHHSFSFLFFSDANTYLRTYIHECRWITDFDFFSICDCFAYPPFFFNGPNCPVVTQCMPRMEMTSLKHLCVPTPSFAWSNPRHSHTSTRLTLWISPYALQWDVYHYTLHSCCSIGCNIHLYHILSSQKTWHTEFSRDAEP